MKKIVKILMSLIIVVSFNSCSDSDNVIDEVLQVETGAILRTLEILSNTLNSSDNSSEFSVSVEEQDGEDGVLFQSIDILVSIKDLSPDNGTTVADDMLIKTIDASAFSSGPHGLPRGLVSATFGEATAAMGLGADDHAPGDVFIFELRLNLTDGRSFGATEAGGSVTGGFFDAPHKYNALILCSPEPGDYRVDMHDSFGDGWQTDGGNGGPGIQVVVDGVTLEVGMCSPYGGSALGTFLENGAGTGCTTWPASVSDPTSEWFEATATITIPVGAQEAVWSFPGDSFGEISFEIFAPDGSLLFDSGGIGNTSAGLLPIALCAIN